MTQALQQQLLPDAVGGVPQLLGELGPHCGLVVWYVWWHCGIREQAAWNIYQQQQQVVGGGKVHHEVTDAEVEGAVAEAYASPEARWGRGGGKGLAGHIFMFLSQVYAFPRSKVGRGEERVWLGRCYVSYQHVVYAFPRSKVGGCEGLAAWLVCVSSRCNRLMCSEAR